MDKIDKIDLRILTVLQNDSSLSQRELADAVGLSQNACWRRLKRLEADGFVVGSRTVVDFAALGLDLTIFVMVRVQNHSGEWSARFRQYVSSIPEVVDCYRVGGNWDYLLKVVTRGMSGYDSFYQKLISDLDFVSVQGIFCMEAMLESRPMDLIKMDEQIGWTR